MIKELIISAFIIVIIFIGNSITDNYANKTIDETSTDLLNLRTQLIKQESEIDFDNAKQDIDKIYQNWELSCEKLAYYIEHDELEKVQTELTGLKGYIENKEQLEAIPEIDKSIFILEHIKDKNDFNLKNIF